MIRTSRRSRSGMRARRHDRLRARVHGTAARPRLSVFRSAKHLILQLIDDDAAQTLVAVSDRQITKSTGGSPEGLSASVARAYTLGELLAERAKNVGITTAVFDRGGYTYHGRVKAVADGARAGGLRF